MANLVFLFYWRNKKFFMKVFLFSFSIFLFVSLFAVGISCFERISLINVLSEEGVDFEIQGTLNKNFSSSNITSLFSYEQEWNDITSFWSESISNDSLVLIISIRSNNHISLVGITFSSHLINQRISSFLNDSLSFFETTINVTDFLIVEELPFNLDILINFDFINQSLPTSLVISPSNALIGYFIDFNCRRISSFNLFLKTIETIDDNFRLFVAQKDLVDLSSIGNTNPDFLTFHPFKQPFDSIIILVSLISLLSSTFLIKIIVSSYYNQIKAILTQLEKRGLTLKTKNRLVVFLPILTDTFALLFLSIVYWLSSFLFGLNLLLAYIIALAAYLYLAFKRYSQKLNENVKSAEKSSFYIIKYIIALLIVSLILLLIMQTLDQILEQILPPWIITCIVASSTIIQYYLITIILAEIYMKLEKRRKTNKNGLSTLFSKTLNSRKNQLKSWFRSTIVLIWSITIIIASIQSFSINYEINEKMLNPADLRIEVNIPLYNITQIEMLPEIENIIPLSKSVEKYFDYYDMYLIDLISFQSIYSELSELAEIDELQENYTYMSENMAKSFDFQDGDLFPTIFGKNGTNVFVNQPIKIIRYFPIIKSIEGRPFVASAYRQEYVNISIVNQLLINFESNISLNQGIEAIKEVLGLDFQIQEQYLSLEYKASLLLYKYFFLVFAVFIGGLNFSLMINQLNSVFRKINLRGLQRRKIRKLFLKTLLPFQISSLIIGFLSGLFYVYIQMPSTISQIVLFTPFHVSLSVSILLILLFPLVSSILTLITKMR